MTASMFQHSMMAWFLYFNKEKINMQLGIFLIAIRSASVFAQIAKL